MLFNGEFGACDFRIDHRLRFSVVVWRGREIAECALRLDTCEPRLSIGEREIGRFKKVIALHLAKLVADGVGSPPDFIRFVRIRVTCKKFFPVS